jgi:hypothetical protein
MKPTKTKLSAAVYLAAAEFMDRGLWGGWHTCTGCCAAIDAQFQYDYSDSKAYLGLFEKLFMPAGLSPGQFYWGESCADVEARQARILALLLAAALVRDGWEVADFVEAGK